jgi:cytochrome b
MRRPAPTQNERAVPAAESRTIRVWDPVVRVFHWTLVGSFVANYFFTEDGSALHEWIGYVAVLMIAVRLVWGFVGTRYARFAAFWPTPKSLLVHLREVAAGKSRRYLSHNPAGAVMMIWLVLMMLALGLSGFLLTHVDYFWGEEWLETLHVLLADGLLMLAGAHVAAAVIESLRHRENLILSMITGNKRAQN